MEYKKISEIKLLENNPRTISDRQFKILCTSIKKNIDYFEARPLILSDRTGELVVIAGNQRYKAAEHLGLKEVPTYLMKNLTEETEREIVIRDNISNGDWDFDLLANEWDTDELEDWGLDGFPFELEPDFEDLIGEEKNKPATMKITFKSPEQLQKAEIDIQEILDRKYEGAYFSISAGEI